MLMLIRELWRTFLVNWHQRRHERRLTRASEQFQREFKR